MNIIPLTNAQKRELQIEDLKRCLDTDKCKMFKRHATVSIIFNNLVLCQEVWTNLFLSYNSADLGTTAKTMKFVSEIVKLSPLDRRNEIYEFLDERITYLRDLQSYRSKQIII